MGSNRGALHGCDGGNEAETPSRLAEGGGSHQMRLPGRVDEVWLAGSVLHGFNKLASLAADARHRKRMSPAVGQMREI